MSGTVCRACRLRLTKSFQTRTFSSTSNLTSIPPESPFYIDVPPSHQADLPLPKKSKGVLPVPRKLFPAKRPDKPSLQYLANATPDKLPHNIAPDMTLSDQGRYKLRMTERRKTHLREGLTELYKRKENMTRAINAKSEAKQAEHARLMAQAEREDARLTNNSIPEGMKPGKHHEISEKELWEIYEKKKANVDRQAAERAEERRDKLHTLYMNARNFITTEEQLNKHIEMEFDEKFFGEFESAASMWATSPPDSIKTMIERTRGGHSVRLGEEASERFNRDQERMKRIAEKLSGGKM